MRGLILPLLVLVVAPALVVAAAPDSSALKGMLIFFDADKCPVGWEPLPSTQGRLIVSVESGQTAGVTVNQPLADREDRQHKHQVQTTITLPEKHIAAIDCCDNQGAHNAKFPFDSATSASSSGLPFSQLLLCRYAPNSTLDTVDVVIPFATIAYFDPEVSSCPSGWSPLKQANGRFLVPGFDRGALQSPAPPLQSGEDRHHLHDYNVTFSTSDVSYAGVDGCCNSNTAESGEIEVSGTSSSESSGLPYVQLLTCLSNTPSFNSSLPPNALLFNEVQCPPGWSIADEVAGRFLVSLPDAGLPGASFGGSALASNASSNPLHQHTVSGSIDTKPAGVGLAAGCCAGGYAKAETYTFSGPSDRTALDWPYMMVPMCRYSGTRN